MMTKTSIAVIVVFDLLFYGGLFYAFTHFVYN
jgi:hypothetical protein